MFESWLISAFAFLITAAIVPGISLDSTRVAVFASVSLFFINYTIKPMLSLCLLPLNLLSSSLVSWIVDALGFYCVTFFISGIHIDSYLDALFGSIVMYFVSVSLTFLNEKIVQKAVKKI